MRTSTSKPGAAPRGFSLVELAAVLLIVSLALGVGLTPLFAGGARELRGEARQFANAAALVAAEAVLEGRPWGVDLFLEPGAPPRPGYRWLRLDDEGWREVLPAGWEAGEGAGLFAAGSELRLEVEGAALAPESRVDLEEALPAGFSPELRFFPSREITPFSLLLGSPEMAEAWRVEGDLLGRIRVVGDAP